MINVLEHKQPPYVPWHFGFTVEAKLKLLDHYGSDDIMEITDNHILQLGDDIGYFEDIGNVKGQVLAESTLEGYDFPDPMADRFFNNIPALLWKSHGRIYTRPDCFQCEIFWSG